MPTPGQELASIDFGSMLGGPLIAAVNAQAQSALSTVNFIKQVGFKKTGTEQNPDSAETGDPVYVTFKYPKEVQPYTPAVAAHITGVKVTSGGSGYTTAPIITISGGGGSGARAEAVVEGGEIVSVNLLDAGSGYTSKPTAGLTGGGGGTGGVVEVEFASATTSQPAVYETMQLQVPILSMLPIPYIRIEDVTIDFNAKINSVEYQKVDESLKVDGSLDASASWGWGSAKLHVGVAYQKSTQSGSNVDRTYSMQVHMHAVQDEMPAGMEKILSILENSIRSVPATAGA